MADCATLFVRTARTQHLALQSTLFNKNVYSALALLTPIRKSSRKTHALTAAVGKHSRAKCCVDLNGHFIS